MTATIKIIKLPTSRSDRKKKLKKFLKRHDDLCNKVFSKHMQGEESMWLTKSGRKLVSKARKKLDYSDNTGPMDIFMILYRNYFKLQKDIDE